MSGSDVEYIKEGLTDVKDTLKELTHNVNDLRILIAGEYLTKKEFDKYKQTKSNTEWKIAGIVFTISAIAFSAMQWIYTLAKG